MDKQTCTILSFALSSSSLFLSLHFFPNNQHQEKLLIPDISQGNNVERKVVIHYVVITYIGPYTLS